MKNINKSLIFILLNLILISLSLGICVLTIVELPPQVPFFYSLPWGEKQLVSKVFLFALPLISFLFLLFNLSIQKIFKIHEDEEKEMERTFIKEALFFVSLSVFVINLITIIKIVRLFI
jgi:hypothetical protein